MNNCKNEIVDYIEDKISLTIEVQIDINFIIQKHGFTSRWNDKCQCIEVLDNNDSFFNIFEGFTRLQAMEF